MATDDGRDYDADDAVYSDDDDGTARSTRRLLNFGPVPAPSSLWGSLVKSGYHIVYGLEVEGIPYLFGERELWTTRGLVAASRNADDFTMSYALVIDEGVRFSVECDRETGVASGRAVDFVFGRQQLADESLGAAIFARPTLRANLTSTINDPADDTFDVDSTSGWDATGLLYVGRECVRYTSTTSTQFGGCVRGVAGYPHYHTANTIGGYRQCTDTPVFWRGRLVTVWAHLCGPDGRFLGDRWCTHGEWCRQEWRGYVRDAPRPAAGGMVLTCLPLVRLAAQEVGAELSGRMLPDWIVATDADICTVGYAAIAEVPGRSVGGISGILSLDAWCKVAQAAANAALTEEITISVRDGKWLRFGMGGTISGAELLVIASTWFLSDGVYWSPPAPSASAGTHVDVPLVWGGGWSGLTYAGAWVVVEIDQSSDASDGEVGATGMLLMEGSGGRALARYDETRATTDGTKRAFRVTAHPNFFPGEGQSGWDPWDDDTTVRVISGAVGTWREVFETVATSSGTGERGPRDTMPAGFGLGLPESWTTASPSGADQQVVAYTPGRTSLEALLGGWLVLRRECLVQRRQDDGRITLDVASTDVIDDTEATAISDTDVLTDGHESPELVEAPNHVRITSSDMRAERPLVVVRDAVRAQAEGVRSMEVSAPGIKRLDALEAGGELILLGDGQSAIGMRLPPWVDVQIGDSVEVTTAHPAVWDWSSGAYAPSSVLGRVVAWSREGWSQAQDVTVLLAGQAQERVYLAPSALVTQAVSATVYRVEKGGALGFQVGDEVLFYERGDESNDSGTVTVSAIDETPEDCDVITVDADPAVDGSQIVITYADYSSAVTRQKRHMFVRSASYWR